LFEFELKTNCAFEMFDMHIFNSNISKARLEI